MSATGVVVRCGWLDLFGIENVHTPLQLLKARGFCTMERDDFAVENHCPFDLRCDSFWSALVISGNCLALGLSLWLQRHQSHRSRCDKGKHP